jgi:hypothetical protein
MEIESRHIVPAKAEAVEKSAAALPAGHSFAVLEMVCPPDLDPLSR